MAIPPPPPPGPPAPPGPPPPPIGGLKLGGSKGGGGDQRSALLQSIQKGTKLKKTVTVDKSGPAISGKVADSSNKPSLSNNSSSGPPPSSHVSNGGPKLGGIFEGMSSMPKLKPVGSRGIGTTRTSPPNEQVTHVNGNNTRSGTGSTSAPAPPPLDFSSELAMTLKRQKKTAQNQNQQQQEQQTNQVINSAVTKVNRGPPPQPPAAATKQHSSSSPTEAINSSLVNKKEMSHVASSHSNQVLNSTVDSLPTANKSTLFGTNATTNGTNSQTVNSSKPVPNYGKPNCAPKPPGIQQLVKPPGVNGKPTVSRHHSMKTPRSPPATSSGLSFSNNQHFGTMRGPPAMCQSQESIVSRPTVPIGRPTVAPPRPPTVKPPPPPTPVRSVSNTNLSNLPLSTAPSNNNVNQLKDQLKNQIVTGGSVNNVSTLHMQQTNTMSNAKSTTTLSRDKTSPTSTGPPLPPHRTCPAPPPPMRQSSTNAGAPVPPQRHSSIRTSTTPPVLNQPQHIANNIVPMPPKNTSMVIDLDAKFAHKFHKVTEFCAPPPFINIAKTYPSPEKKTKCTHRTTKPKAPSPPRKRDSDKSEAESERQVLRLGQSDWLVAEGESSYC